MGIHGLTSFIDNNPKLLKDKELHDCRVVVDGNNLYHFLYYYCQVRHQFGGDYDIFHKKITQIFSYFKSCNIEAFVVFDGAYTQDGKKFKTTISRARDRVFAAERVMYGHRGTLIPCLAQMVFRQTLDKLGVHHVTCDFEADNQLATLANKWNCPVISSDSDFYIFELSGGFIPLDYVDFRPRLLQKKSSGEADAFLLVQYYHVDEFIKCFPSLSGTVLPLFATMLGNDYVSAAEFETFYRKKTPKIAQRYSASKKHEKIISVLYWLEENKNKEDIVSQVLTFINPALRNRVTQILMSSINGYRDTAVFESFDLQRFLEGDKQAAVEKSDYLKGPTGQKLLPWFLTACRNGAIPVILLNMALLHRVILPIQVEDIHLPASFLTSTAIREVTYGWLCALGRNHMPTQQEVGVGQHPAYLAEVTKGDHMPLPQAAAPTTDGMDGRASELTALKPANVTKATLKLCDSENPPEAINCLASTALKQLNDNVNDESDFVEYTRHIKEFRRISVEPRTNLSCFSNALSLEQIPELTLPIRQSIWMEALGTSNKFCEKFDPDLSVFISSVVFWSRHATTPGVTLQHMKSVLLSSILLHLHREIAERKENVHKNLDHDKTDDSKVNFDGLSQESSGTHVTEARGVTADTENSRQDDRFNLDKQQTGILTNTSLHYSRKMSIKSTCSNLDKKQLLRIRDNFRKYYLAPAPVSSRNPANKAAFHRTAQLQACIHDAACLNSLLLCPFPNPEPALLLNGSFVYNMVQELMQRSNPDLFIAEMLVKGSAVLALFDSLCFEVLTEVGEGVFVNLSHGPKKCKGVKKKNSSSETGESRNGERMSTGSTAMRKDGDEAFAFFDINNRFSALLLDCDS